VPQRRQVMANNRFSRAILFAPGYSSSVRFEPLPKKLLKLCCKVSQH
jgi:hypothetical protein